jgi:shikimate dehydrogenase
MKHQPPIERLFGLIGYPLSHSFSKRYFTAKFEREGIAGCAYELFPLETIAALPGLLERHPALRGLNVTIPYKELVIPYLDELDAGAAAIGAVNTIKRVGGRLLGYNTDVHGFEQSLRGFLRQAGVMPGQLQALVLGTGGSSKAVAFALRQLGIGFRFVSRSPGAEELSYQDLEPGLIRQHRLIINTTPLGMSPHLESSPPLPYAALGPGHLLFDLVYNPPLTTFLAQGQARGAAVKNGLEMLEMQAERAWEIWEAVS